MNNLKNFSNYLLIKRPPRSTLPLLTFASLLSASASKARNCVALLLVYALRSASYALGSALWVLRSTLYALRSTLYALIFSDA